MTELPTHPADAAAGGPAARSDSAARVLAAALALFAEQGFEGTSLQQIADRLGVTKAAVYYHFRSKDDLLTALVEPSFVELGRRLDEVRALGRDSVRQRRALEVYVDYLLRHRALAVWLSQDAAALVRPAVWDRVRSVNDEFAELLTGSPPGPFARFWGSAITRGISGAVLGQPDASDEWLREQLAVLGEHLLTACRAARRRAEAPTS
jgi:AcrR family transcriptional regulator